MKQAVFKLIDRLGNGKTYQVDLFEEEFFEDPAYRTIEDFKHAFTIYSPFANKSKIIKAVSYTHSPSPRDGLLSRMPSSA